MGAILSQHSGEKIKINPVVFFFKKLSPVERYYDVGNQELLAVKLRLEEGSHSLTTNLKCLCTAKSLNPRLIFKKIKFDLVMQAWDMNGKADTLSHIESKESETPDQGIILPETCWIKAIEWKFDRELDNTLPYHSQAEYPEDKKYVPLRLCSKIITWAHTESTLKTLQLLKEKYWYINS